MICCVCSLCQVSGKKQVQSDKHSFTERDRVEKKDAGLQVSVCVTAERATSSS